MFYIATDDSGATVQALFRVIVGAGATTPDISGDGDVNNEDALLIYYVLTFKRFLDASLGLTASFLGTFSTGPKNQAAYQATIADVVTWGENPANDIDGRPRVTNQDAILAYYVLTFKRFLDASPGLTASFLGTFSSGPKNQAAYQATIADVIARFPETTTTPP